MSENRIPLEKAEEYILAGKAWVVFYNTQNGRQFKYQVKAKNNGWFVYTQGVRYCYIGFIGGTSHKFYSKNEDERLQEYVDAFAKTWASILTKRLHPAIHILHDGTCGACGRQLTDARSLEIGIGPECRKKLGIT